jgi:hypothetical protein
VLSDFPLTGFAAASWPCPKHETRRVPGQARPDSLTSESNWSTITSSRRKVQPISRSSCRFADVCLRSISNAMPANRVSRFYLALLYLVECARSRAVVQIYSVGENSGQHTIHADRGFFRQQYKGHAMFYDCSTVKSTLSLQRIASVNTTSGENGSNRFRFLVDLKLNEKSLFSFSTCSELETVRTKREFRSLRGRLGQYNYGCICGCFSRNM